MTNPSPNPRHNIRDIYPPIGPTLNAAKRLKRVLWNDPASGVYRHADAGYGIAVDHAKAMGLRLPVILGA